MTFKRQKRIDDPTRFPLGVHVRLRPDRVLMAMIAGNDDLARALEFVQWLVRDGAWIARGDTRDPEPVGDPSRLFPDNLPDPATLIDDPTLTPVVDGTLVTVDFERDGHQPTLAVHSSGEWRYQARGRALRGGLSDDARAAFNLAVASLDPDDPDLPEQIDPPTRLSVLLQTKEDEIDVEVDTVRPPAAYQPLVTMVSDWTTALDRWTPSATIAPLSDIRAAT